MSPMYTLLLLLALGAGTEPAFRELARLPLDARFEPPIFFPLRPRLLDRGGLVLLGHGGRADTTARVALDLKTLAKRTLRLPTIDPQGARLEVELACYDSADGKAGLVINRRQSSRWSYHFAEWHLSGDRLGPELPLAEGTPGKVTVSPIAYAPARQACLLAVIRDGGALRPPGVHTGGPFTATLLAATEELRELGNVVSQQSLNLAYYDEGHDRVAIAEYGELAQERTRAHLVALDGGEPRAFTIPRGVRTFVFDPDGFTVYLYSIITGEVWVIDTRSGERLRKSKVGDRGHALGFIDPSTLLLVRNHALHLLERASLSEKRRIATVDIVSRIPHVEGSLVVPGRVLLKSFSLKDASTSVDELYVLELPRGRP